MVQLGMGLAFGLTAVQIPQLSSSDSDIQITRSEASWIASVLPLFSPIGCLISGYVMDRFGRRIMLIFCQVPMVIGWIYTSLAKTPKHIIIGRAITGIGCGLAMAPPRIYTSEICLPNMRGVIGAFPALALSIGISVQAGLGQYFKWQFLCYICCMFAMINFCLFYFLPETPYHILKTKTPEEARVYLAKFRSQNYDLDKEMDQLIDFKTDNDIRKLSVLESIQELFTKSSCKPFSLIIAYVFIAQTSGISCLLMWPIEMLTVAKSSFDVNTGNFLLSLTRLVVGTITAILLFSVGRRPLALISATGVTIVCFTVGFYLTYHDESSLIPQICFMVYMVFASLGYYTLPFLMSAELYPLQVRGILCGITVSIGSLLIFGSTKLCPLLMDNFGLAYTLVLFGGCSFLGTLFLFFFLPETKDLTLQEIEEYYNELRPTLVSQRRIISMQQWEQQSFTGTSRSKHSSNLSRKSLTPSQIVTAGSSIAKLGAKRRLSVLLGRDNKSNKDLSRKGKIREQSSIVSLKRAAAPSTESIVIRPNRSNESNKSIKNQDTLKIKEIETNKDSDKIDDSIGTDSVHAKEPKKIMRERVSFMEQRESAGTSKDKSQPSTSTDNKDIKPLKINDTENIKESKSSKESIKSIESKKSSQERIATKKKDSKESLKDENQPSTSKKNT